MALKTRVLHKIFGGLVATVFISTIALSTAASGASNDATLYGSGAAITLNKPIAGMASTPTGHGYCLTASDGGIFSFGDAAFYGSTGNIGLNKPIVGMASTPTGHGYWLTASDGGIFTFGNATFFGSAGNSCIGTVVGISTSLGANGYWIAASNGAQAAFSTSTKLADGTPCASGTEVGGTQADVIARDFFDRVNAERAARGLPTLGWDQGLAENAHSWSVTMGTSNNFKHSNLEPLLARFSAAAENIAYGGRGVTTGAVHVAWMNSDGHRANILAPNLDVMGVGLYCGSNGTLWATEQFGRFPGSSKPSGWGSTPPAQPIVRGDAGEMACP